MEIPEDTEKNEEKENENEEQNNEVNFYSQKLKERFHFLKIILYCSFGVYVGDLILIFAFPKVFFCLINIFSIILVNLGSFFCLYIFRHNFEFISYFIYKSTIRVIYVLFFMLFVHYADMFYLLLFQILLNTDEDGNSAIFEQTFAQVFFSIIGFFFYFMINLAFPVLIVYKILLVKNSVKDLGKAQGQSYDKVPTIELSTHEEQK